MIPRNTTTAVANDFGVEEATLRSRADMKPVPSATPTPIMMVKQFPAQKSREIRHHRGDHIPDAVRRQKAYGLHCLFSNLTACAVQKIICDRQSQESAQGGHKDDNSRQNQENHCRVRQPVPHPLHGIQGFQDHAFFCPSFAKTIPPIMCILCPVKFLLRPYSISGLSFPSLPAYITFSY